MINIKDEIYKLKFKFGFYKTIQCNQEDSKSYAKQFANGGSLPNGITSYYDSEGNMVFYETIKEDLSKEEIKEFLELKNLSTLCTIKKCVVFHTILTIIGLILPIILICISLFISYEI